MLERTGTESVPFKASTYFRNIQRLIRVAIEILNGNNFYKGNIIDWDLEGMNSPSELNIRGFYTEDLLKIP